MSRRKDPPPTLPRTVEEAEDLERYRRLTDALDIWERNVEPADLHPLELRLLETWQAFRGDVE